jgi:hypothetical protein
VPQEIRDLIRTISRENPLWGAPRLHSELLKRVIDVGETRVSKYLVRYRKPPSQTWQTFLTNHVNSLVSVDFFTVPTIRFQLLYVFLVLAHDQSDWNLRERQAKHKTVGSRTRMKNSPSKGDPCRLLGRMLFSSATRPNGPN